MVNFNHKCSVMGEIMNQNDPWGDVKLNIKLPEWASKFRNMGIGFIILIILAVWLLTGIFIVNANEKAVVKRFGKVIKIVDPGPHYHFPYPIETIDKAAVTKIHRLEIGYRSLQADRTRNIPNESLMLTGDENIISIALIVQFRVRDITKYLYNVVNVEKTIKDAAESAIREVAGKEKIDNILTIEKGRIQTETMDILQHILDGYNTGIFIVAVQLQDVAPPEAVDAAFKDVASAREDKNRFINEAQSYRNEIIPATRAKAASMVLEAEAYEQEKIERANGDASRFLDTLAEYKKAPEVTTKRLYLENISTFMKKSKIYLFDSNIKELKPVIGLDKIKGEVVE